MIYILQNRWKATSFVSFSLFTIRSLSIWCLLGSQTELTIIIYCLLYALFFPECLLIVAAGSGTKKRNALHPRRSPTWCMLYLYYNMYRYIDQDNTPCHKAISASVNSPIKREELLSGGHNRCNVVKIDCSVVGTVSTEWKTQNFYFRFSSF